MAMVVVGVSSICSCGLEHVIIACGHLTNMQGCHGNFSGGLYVCADYHR